MKAEEFNYSEFVADDIKHMRELLDAIEKEGKKHDQKVFWNYIRPTRLQIQSCYQGLRDYRNGMIQDGEDLLNQLGL